MPESLPELSESMQNRLRENEEIRRDFTRCHDLAQKAACRFPEKDVWAGTVSERLSKIFDLYEAQVWPEKPEEERLKVERDGAEARSKIVLEAKNTWADRARAALALHKSGASLSKDWGEVADEMAGALEGKSMSEDLQQTSRETRGLPVMDDAYPEAEKAYQARKNKTLVSLYSSHLGQLLDYIDELRVSRGKP